MKASNSFAYFFTIASFGFSFVSLGISCINRKYIKNHLTPLFILFFINVSFELTSRFFAEFGENNLSLYHYFTIIEFTLISLFYSLFFKRYFNSIVINLLIPVFLIAGYIDYKIHGLESMDSFSISVESIVLSCYSLFFFYYILKNLLFDNLFAAPVFWLNTAILLYFSGNLILFVFSNHMAKHANEKYIILWSIIHSFFNIVYNIFLSIGFWKTRVK